MISIRMKWKIWLKMNGKYFPPLSKRTKIFSLKKNKKIMVQMRKQHEERGIN